MLRKIDTFNSEFISTLDENLRSLFLQSSIVDFQREPFALLASPDENTFPTFEDVLAGTGLIYLQHFLEDKVEFPLLLMWLDIQEYDLARTHAPHRTAHTHAVSQSLSGVSDRFLPIASLPVSTRVSCRFQKIPPQQTTMDYMNRQATKLYDLYIRQGSVDQVPFDRKLIGSILLALESRPSPVLFNPAQDFVEVILRDEVYPQFLSSEPCANLRRDTLTQQQNGGSSAIAEEIARDKQQKIAQLRQASLGKTATTNTPQPRTKEPNINKKPNGTNRDTRMRDGWHAVRAFPDLISLPFLPLCLSHVLCVRVGSQCLSCPPSVLSPPSSSSLTYSTIRCWSVCSKSFLLLILHWNPFSSIWKYNNFVRCLNQIL